MKPLLSLLCLVLLCAQARAAEPLAIETKLIDSDAIHGATFQSHNQKVVSNARGLFLVHLHSRNEKYTAQKWRLSWSRDGGKTFATLYEATEATNPPVLETDSKGNLYVGLPDFVTHEIVLHRFLADENYRKCHSSKAPKGAAGKYAMALDEKREQLYFLSHNGTLITFGLDGKLKSSTRLLIGSEKIVPQYPSLHLDSTGTLHAAWTTLQVPMRRYWAIHHLQSADGGATWKSFAGKSSKPPIVADEKGPGDRITLDDEFTPSTWLSNFLVTGGKAHFLYLARTEPERQHYVRYDVATGKRELDRQPAFRGDKLSISGLSGFFATTSGKKDAPLYCVSQSGQRLVCLVSHDNGGTWRDHAVSEKFVQPYAVGGCREVTSDGWIIGSFTDVMEKKKEGWRGGKVYFIRIAAARAK